MKSTSTAIIALVTLVNSWSIFGQCVAEFAAVAGTFSPPFVATNGYVTQTIQTGVTNGGKAVYSFSITNAGQYAILAVVEAPNQNANSVFVNVDAEPKDPEMKWEIPVSTGFSTNGVCTSSGQRRYFDLTKGTHQIIVRGSEANVKLLHLRVMARPAAPTGLRVVSSP